MGDIISHAASFLLLALLNCANSVLVRGVYLDAEEPAGQCVIFPVYYVRMFVQKERQRKQRRLMANMNKQEDHINVQPLLDNYNGKPKPVIVKMGSQNLNNNNNHNKNGCSTAASKELESQQQLMIESNATVVNIPERPKPNGRNA